MKKIIFLIIWLCTIADVALTTYGINLGIIEESWAPMRWMIANMGLYPAMATNLIIVSGLIFIIYKFIDKTRFPRIYTGIVLIAKLWVMVLHLDWIMKI